MMARRLFLFGFAAALVTAFGCSSGGDGGTSAPALLCSDAGPAAANAVTMTCGGSTDGTIEQVDVVMGGPAPPSTTVQGLNFDVTYDTTNLEFVPAGSYASPLFPNALIAVGLFNGLPGRVVVSIQNPAGAVVLVPTGQNIALSLSFRRTAGMTFGLTPVAFENAEATNASSTIFIASRLALAYQ